MKGAKRNSGQSSIEFSVVLLLMLTILFGVLETGRLLMSYVMLADAVRAGTRYAAVHGSYSSSPSGPGCDASGGVTSSATVAPSVYAVVQNLASLAGLTVTASICYTGGNSTGGSVQVSAFSTYASMVSIVGIPSFTLSSTSQAYINY